MIKEKITYEQYSSLIGNLVKQIKDYQSRENSIKYLCGIPRGGLPIAVHLSHYLDIPMVEQLENWDCDFNEKELLIVDDIADTGITFGRLKKKFLTATLFYKPRSAIIPNFYVQKVPNNLWVVFPWEKEDETPNRPDENEKDRTN